MLSLRALRELYGTMVYGVSSVVVCVLLFNMFVVCVMYNGVLYGSLFVLFCNCACGL